MRNECEKRETRDDCVRKEMLYASGKFTISPGIVHGICSSDAKGRDGEQRATDL